MKSFEVTLNGRAVEVAIQSIFGNEGFQRIMAAYNSIDQAMANAYGVGHEDATKIDLAKIEQIRADEHQAGYNLGIQDGRASVTKEVPADPQGWVDRIATAAAVDAQRGGGAAALQHEFDLQRDSGDEMDYS